MNYLIGHLIPFCIYLACFALLASAVVIALCKSAIRAYEFPNTFEQSSTAHKGNESGSAESHAVGIPNVGPRSPGFKLARSLKQRIARRLTLERLLDEGETLLAESQSIARSCGNDPIGQDVASHLILANGGRAWRSGIAPLLKSGGRRFESCRLEAVGDPISTHLPASNLKQHNPHAPAVGSSLTLARLLSPHLQARR